MTGNLEAGEGLNRGRKPPPPPLPKMGFGHDAVLRYAATLQEVQGKMVAGSSTSLVGRLLKERDGPRRIVRHSLPCGAHQRQGKLRIRISLRRGLFVPGSR